MAAPIRVLLVDDSPLALTVLRRMLAASPEMEVVGAAHNGREALELIPRLRPTVICTDYEMPVMDGLELTRQVMATFPRPILVISSVLGGENSQKAFDLLEAGAVDVFPKPRGAAEGDAAARLISKVKLVAGVFVIRREPKARPAEKASPERRPPGDGITAAQVRIVAIGASTGGPQALQIILSKLPARFPAPVLCVQHISAGFLVGLVDWLAAQCRVKIQIARPGEMLLPGRVYFPEEETHLLVDRQGRLQTSREPAVELHRPSVTVTFKSVARCYGEGAAAVLLTGMGQDGGEGMVAIARAGGMTIAQDEASCVIFGMPKQAIDLGAAQYVLPPARIAATLIEAVTLKAKAA